MGADFLTFFVDFADFSSRLRLDCWGRCSPEDKGVLGWVRRREEPKNGKRAKRRVEGRGKREEDAVAALPKWWTAPRNEEGGSSVGRAGSGAC